MWSWPSVGTPFSSRARSPKALTPTPASAYPVQFYPGTNDQQSAQVIELAPGTEKAGIDFQMRPVAVTYIHGKLAPGSAEWRGRSDLQVALQPIEVSRTVPEQSIGARVNQADGSFALQRVFPGSYNLVVFSLFGPRGQNNDRERVGAAMRGDVGDRPLEVSVPLHRAVDLAGRVEIEATLERISRSRSIRFEFN